MPLVLICDNVRDPGSLGTILRCAAAAGCERVLLTQGPTASRGTFKDFYELTVSRDLTVVPLLTGCVDPWEPKVLRAAMGAHFRLPMFSGLNWDSVCEHLPKPVTVHIAEDASGNTRSSVRGIQKPGTDRDDAVLEEYTESDSDESDDEVSLPCMEQKVYHEDWAQRNTALVISGETHGPSEEAVRLAEETDGRKLFVPMAPGVECLNSAMMASILLFEGRRQLLKIVQNPRRAKSIMQ